MRGCVVLTGNRQSVPAKILLWVACAQTKNRILECYRTFVETFAVNSTTNRAFSLTVLIKNSMKRSYNHFATQPITDTKELGLVVGLEFFKHVLGTDYLHYGWWEEGVEVHCTNLRVAQDEYTRRLLEQIPEGAHTILDVGCGSGRTAKVLSDAGYQVECISPSAYLTENAQELLGDAVQVHHARFEDVDIRSKYDVVLFSESFQYIGLDHSLSKARSLLNESGSILICDFFRQDDVQGNSPIGGGHSLREFYQKVDQYGYTVTKNEDITNKVAPTVDIYNALTMHVVRPVYYGLLGLLRERFALLARIIFWKYRKKLEKVESKHFSGQRSAANFCRYKRYLTVALKIAA